MAKQVVMPQMGESVAEGTIVRWLKKVGDAVELTGVVGEYKPSDLGLSVTQVTASAVTILSSGNPIPAALVIGVGGLLRPTESIDSDGFALFNPVKDGEDFLVYDAKTGDDITRSVLAQIIFEQENKAGQNLLPTTFLRQLIRFYGDSMRTMVPSFLEFSMANFAKDQDGLREKFSTGFSGTGFGSSALQTAIEQQVRANMGFFGDAMKMFTGFAPPVAGAQPPVPAATAPSSAAPAYGGGELDDLKRQMLEMQQRLEDLAKK